MRIHKFLAWALTLVLALMPISAHAADDQSEIIGGIVTYLSEGKAVQDWIDTSLATGVGTSSDNLIPALLRMDSSYRFDQYIDALDAKLDEGIKNVVSRQRSALMLAILGKYVSVPEGLADETIGKLGIMSDIFGQHLLNNGFESTLWTTDALLNQLISMQLSDGGWAVNGSVSDPDVTAMCIQALASVENSNECETAIQRGLDCLSKAQNDDGSFSSYGAASCESCAQVVLALSTLGIDSSADARFIKNGVSVWQAMLSFRRDDGGFAHLSDGESNSLASAQALLAIIAAQNLGISIYSSEGLSTATAAETASSIPTWKKIALLTITAFAFVGTCISLLRKRARGKRILAILLLCGIAAFAVCAIDIESAGSYYQAVERSETPVGQAWLSIRCDKVPGRADDGSTPENGEILMRTSVDFYEGDSVFDLLTYAARTHGLHMEHEGSGDLLYVNGINHLYEYAYGDLSGWIYMVNGEIPSVGCGNYAVKNGDEILWQYTLALGEDLR